MTPSTQTQTVTQTITKKFVFKNGFVQKIYNWKLEEVSSCNLNKAVWNLTTDPALVQQVVVAQQASWRVQSKKVKDRSEVSGGGKKPWKQKGTGRARHGSRRSPIWRGGGVTFGPTGEENYSQKVNKKVFSKAIKMLLSSFRQNRALFVWKDVDFDQPKTKKVVEFLKSLELEKEKILFVVDNSFMHLQLSLNNLQNVKMISAQTLNPYDLVNSDKLLIHDETLVAIEQRLEK